MNPSRGRGTYQPDIGRKQSDFANVEHFGSPRVDRPTIILRLRPWSGGGQDTALQLVQPICVAAEVVNVKFHRIIGGMFIICINAISFTSMNKVSRYLLKQSSFGGGGRRQRQTDWARDRFEVGTQRHQLQWLNTKPLFNIFAKTFNCDSNICADEMHRQDDISSSVNEIVGIVFSWGTLCVVAVPPVIQLPLPPPPYQLWLRNYYYASQKSFREIRQGEYLIIPVVSHSQWTDGFWTKASFTLLKHGTRWRRLVSNARLKWPGHFIVNSFYCTSLTISRADVIITRKLHE